VVPSRGFEWRCLALISKRQFACYRSVGREMGGLPVNPPWQVGYITQSPVVGMFPHLPPCEAPAQQILKPSFLSLAPYSAPMASFTASAIVPPTPAATTPARTASAAEDQPHIHDPIDAFFGYRFASSATQESRHDSRSRASSIMIPADVEALPAYAEDDDSLPEYTPHAEPVTLAMYLFKFGFCEYSLSLFAAGAATYSAFSIPTLLDLRRFHPHLSSARATLQRGLTHLDA
jgi:hypothetical protein